MDDATRVSIERDAKLHRWLGWVAFIALLATGFLPDRYTLFVFALPVGTIALALYYWRFNEIADLKNGTFVLLLVVSFLAVAALQSGFERREMARKIDGIVCNTQADTYSEMTCSEVYATLFPEPTYGDDE